MVRGAVALEASGSLARSMGIRRQKNDDWTLVVDTCNLMRRNRTVELPHLRFQMQVTVE